MIRASHPTRRIDLNGGGWFTLTAHHGHGHDRLVCHEGVARGVHFDLTPDEMRELSTAAGWLADLAQLPEVELVCPVRGDHMSHVTEARCPACTPQAVES